MIAAYLIGGPVSAATLGAGMEVCESPTQTRCLIGWNARGPRYISNDLEFRNPEAPPGTDPLSDLICVNPLTWDSRRPAAPAATDAGPLFFDAEVPTLMPGFADAKCENGRLLVSAIGEPPRDLMSQILDWMMGPENYHPIEYQLYYVNLRRNAVQRVAAYAQQHSTR